MFVTSIVNLVALLSYVININGSTGPKPLLLIYFPREALAEESPLEDHAASGFMRAYIYIYKYVNIYIYTQITAHIHVYIHMYIYIYVCMYTCSYVSVYVYNIYHSKGS